MIDQAESRIHRMGQQAAAVNLYYLLATSSKFAGDDDRLPDGAMFGALVKKAQVASRVVDPHAAASSLADAQVVTPRPRAARREEASRLAAEAERGARRAAHAAEAEARLEAELAAAVASAAAAAVPEAPRLSTSEMKRALDAADVDTTECIERSDVERLYKWAHAERCPTCDCALPYPPRRRVRHIRNCSGVRV